MARLETVSSVAAKQRRRFLPQALIYPFRIFKLGKSAPQSSPPQCDHIILTISLVFLCFFGIVLFLLVLISSMVGFVYMSEITNFVFLIKFPISLWLWIGLL